MKIYLASLLLLLTSGASLLTAQDHPFETDATRAPGLETGGDCLIRDVWIHSAVEPAQRGDVLVVDGRIEAISTDGAGIPAPDGVVVIDGEGRHLAPGAVDTHSHMAIERGINESTLSITADCDITDVINPDDVGLYRALAGGTTTIQCLHGSANAIGGRSEVLKLRWHETSADALRFEGAPQGIKFALGENPKRSNWGEPGERFPGSRPGVEAVFDRGFMRALEYRDEWAAYEAAEARGEDVAPPRFDVRLDVLVGILEGDVTVHSHCYREDEIVMLLRVAERYGFTIGTLQHVLEGYKVAHEIAEHGAGTSTFSDWWGYKAEAYDAIPHNAALLDEAGVLSTINSDSGELVRHLYHEAAKSLRYTDLDPIAALRLATLNGALQLDVGHRTGSIEVGKDADLALLTADPLSVYARVEWTMVDGEIEFERVDAFGLDDEAAEARPLDDYPVVEASYDPDGGPVLALVGGTIHTVTGGDIENGTLIVQGERILDLGERLPIPAGADILDVTGLDLWPGILALDTGLGLTEIGSVRGTVDTREFGGDHPDLRVSSSVNADSAHIPVSRSAGITRTQVAPQRGGPMMGQSAVMKLDGETWEELLTVDRDMLHIRFPSTSNNAEKKEEPKSVEAMRELLEEGRDYLRLNREADEHGTPRPSYDSRLAALEPFVTGEKRVALHADNAQTILNAIKFAQEEELDAVLYGCTEGWKIADRIAASGIPVVIGPVYDVPSSRYDPYDASYANPALLHRAGVEFAIMAKSTDNARNTAMNAGMAVGFGLPWEEGVRAITLYPARILGLESELGSLAPGKLADVVVTDGDLLEIATQVRYVLIDGELQDLGNRQTDLYERYRARMLEMRAR